MSSMHVQRLTLTPDEEHVRVPLDWDVLLTAEDWKTLSFVRVK